MAVCLYSDAGFAVLPVALGKHPGSIVGKGWPAKSSRDPRQLARWWSSHPDAGIALHTGASGITAFDVDLDADELPTELSWLQAGRFQSSRQGVGARGHYVFDTRTELFASGHLKLADGTVVGEIRSGNTVIIAEPSPHAKADTGGRYRWRAEDAGQEIPALPAIARGYLRPLGTAGIRGGVVATDAAVTQALGDWVGKERLRALDNLVGWISSARAGTRDTARDALRIAACESRAGFYPLKSAVDRLKAAAMDSYTARGESFDGHGGEHEFARLVANGVGYAASRALAEIRAEAHRPYGTHHSEPNTGQRARFGGTYRRAFRPAYRPAFRSAGRY